MRLSLFFTSIHTPSACCVLQHTTTGGNLKICVRPTDYLNTTLSLMSFLKRSHLLQNCNARWKPVSVILSNFCIILVHINYKTPLSDHDTLSHAQVLSLEKRNFLVIFTHYFLLSLPLTAKISRSYWHFARYSFPHTGFDVVTNVFSLCVCFSNSHSGGWSPSWVHSVRRPLNGLLYLPREIMIMENLVEWRLAGETEVLGEKPNPAALCPPQIPLDQTRVRTRAAAMVSQRLTAWAMARSRSVC
jgi:hypothetical protein